MKRKLSLIALLTIGLLFLFASCINVEDSATKKYTVTFMNGEEVYLSDEYVVGTKVVFPEENPVKDDDESYTYDFKGWSLTEDGETEEEGAVVSSDLTYYAVYDAQAKQPAAVTYTVTFFDGVTGEVLKTEKVEKGKDAQPPETPVHAGYTFTGWDGDYTNITGRTDITAKYEKNSYTLVRHYLGKEMTETLFYGDAISLSAIELPQGLQFMGWYTSESFDKTVEEAYPDGMPAADESGRVDIYAKYAFEFSGASLALPQTAVYGGDPVRVQTRVYQDIVYTFEWSDANGEWSGSSDSAEFAFRRAGEQTVSVRITATYQDGSFTDSIVLSQTVTVQKRVLTIGLELVSDTVVYGTAPEATVTYSGFYANEQAELTKNVKVVYLLGEERFDASKLSVGVYTVTLEGADFANYEYTLPEKSLTVEKKTLTVTVSADDFTYGESAVPVVSYDGFVYGEDEGVLGGALLYSYKKNGAPYAEETFTAGEYEALVSGYTSENYEIAFVNDTFTVAKKSASATLTAENITYGEAAQFGFTLSGVLEGDKAKFIPEYSVTKGGKPVSAEKLGAGDYSLTAAFADEQIVGNYDLTVNAASFAVSKAALSVGVSVNGTYTYGDTPSAKITFAGFVWEEGASALSGKAAFTYTKNGAPYTVSGNFGAGSYTVAVSGYTSENYEISYAQPVSFTVEKKALTLTVKVQNSDLKYGDAVFGDINAEGFVFGESLSTLGNPQVIYQNAEGERVTSFPASDSAYTATTQAQSENYEIEIVSAFFTVAKRALTIGLELVSDTVVYGTAPQASVTYSGFYANEQAELTKNVKVVYRLEDESFDGSKLSVGVYTVTLEGADFANYEYTLPEKSLTVEKATLTVTVSADDFTYGESAVPVVSYDGFVYGEDEGVLGGSLLYSYKKNGAPYAEKTFTAGEYEALVSGYTSENYEIAFVNDTFTVAKKDVTVIVTAEKDSYTFGETAAADWNAEGLAAGDEKDVLGEVSLVYRKGDAVYTGYPQSKLFAAGSYTVTAEGFASENYNVVSVQNDSFTVEKRSFVVSGSLSGASGTQLSKEIGFFDSEEIFEFIGTVVLNTTDEGEYIATDAESFNRYFIWQDGYKIVVKGTDEDVTENFEISYNLDFQLLDHAFVGTVTTPSQKTLAYDGKARPFGVTVSGADEIGYTIEYSVNDGDYSETVPSLTDAGVYAVRYRITAEHYEGREGSYVITIERAKNVISTSGVIKTYTYTGEEIVVGSGATATFGTVQYSGNAFTDAGKYTVNLTVAESANYLSAQATVEITVNKADYIVSAATQKYTYNGKAQGAAISVTAIGDDAFTVTYNGQTDVAQFANAGTHTVAFSVSGNENYKDLSGEYEIVIAKAANSISTAGMTGEYDYTGNEIVVDSGASALFGTVVYSDNAFTNAGNYTVTLTVAETENFAGADATFKVTVNKAQVQIGGSYQYTYNGQEQGEISVNAPDSTYEITFSYAGGTYDTTPLFRDAGIYTVGYSVKATQNYVETNGSYTVTIAQAQLTVNNPGDQSKEYDGEPFGTGVTVSGAFDDGYTIAYICNGEPVESVQFTDRGEYVITYTVSGKNYETVSGTFTVSIEKVKGSIDVSSVVTEYTYNGQAQIVDFSGVTYVGDGKFTAPENFTFTTVAEGNGKEFTFTLEEGVNYQGTTVTVTITVNKATYTVEDIPENALKDPDSDILLGYGKTLADVALSDGFYWKNETIGLASGVYDAYYCADEANYEKYDLQITITARKDKVTVTPNKNLEANYGITSLDNLAGISALGEGSRELSADEIAQLYAGVTTDADFSVGGTYLVTYTLKENPYYEAAFETGGTEFTTWLKIKSVGIDDALYTIEDALNAAQSGNTVIVKNNTAFASSDLRASSANPYSGTGYYTVKSGVVLLVPYNSSYSTNTKDCNVNWEAVGTTPFVTLAVTSGTQLYVDGKLIVNALIVQQSGTTSTVKGNNYGSMEVCEGATITLRSGAVYESIGFSYGKGSIVAESGAYVYELFNMVGYKGGTISNGISGTVFPLNQYSLSGISCKLEIQKGSHYYAKAFTAALSNAIKVNADVLFISDSDAAFMQMTGTGGSIYKWIDESNGKVNFDIHADVQFHNMSVDLDGYALDTAGKEIPIPGNFKISASSGTTTIPSDIRIKLLPGAALIVEEGAVVDIYGKLYSYGSKDSYSMKLNGSTMETWQDGNESIKAYPYSNMDDAYRIKPILDYNASSAAIVSVGGSVNVYSGAVFACEASGTGAVAKISFAADSVLSGTIKEDYSHSEKFLGLPICKKVYFDTTFTARGENGETFEVGKTYLFGEGGWTAQ